MTTDVGDRQAARSRETQRKLLDAAIEGLSEVGYANLTVRWIAARAGVTRGAMQHHYASKADLVGAAVARMGGQAVQGLRQAADARPDGTTSVEDFVDVLWLLHRTPLFYAGLELWTAARHDEDLRLVLRDVELRLLGSLDLAVRLLGPVARRPGFDVDLEQVVATMRGLALRGAAADGRDWWAEMRPRLVALVAGA